MKLPVGYDIYGYVSIDRLPYLNSQCETSQRFVFDSTALLHEAAGVRVQGAGQLQWSADEAWERAEDATHSGKVGRSSATTFPPVR